jgi:hypothetical protein
MYSAPACKVNGAALLPSDNENASKAEVDASDLTLR